MIIYGKFHQNRPIRMSCRDDTHTRTDRQTHTQTDTHTHRHPWFDHNIFSQNLTESKDVHKLFFYEIALHYSRALLLADVPVCCYPEPTIQRRESKL